MTTLFQSLFVVLASATHRELARQIHYLKVENQILRSKLPKRITVTPSERRRLTQLAVNVGRAIHALATIVSPGTILRWIRESQGKRVPQKRGRKRKPIDVQTLVIKLARENAWGYTRILGELKKLGIRSISRNTVCRILREQGFDPGPTRGAGTWDDFLKRHAVSLWQCDFFSQRILTATGIRDAFVLVFIHVKTRQVLLSPATLHPDEAWVVNQTDTFVAQARRRGLRVRIVQHDRDGKFSAAFTAALKRKRIKAQRNGYRSPNLNAFVERFIQTIRRECLDHFIVLGCRHLDYLCRQFGDHYHAERPHQSLDNEPILPFPNATGPDSAPPRSIRCKTRLGGLLKSYSRKAA